MPTYRELSVIEVTKPTYFLAKIEKPGIILIRIYSGVDYPPQLGPDISRHNYTISNRQE